MIIVSQKVKRANTQNFKKITNLEDRVTCLLQYVSDTYTFS